MEQLYRRHMKAVYLYLYSLCRDHGIAEDLMQETFLRAFCSLDNAGRELLPWLLTVARNLYVDTWRREKRLDRQGRDVRWEKEADGGAGILDLLIRKEQNQRLYQAIQMLKNMEKEVIVLYYFTGISQEEIGRILNLSYANTRVILYRAKKNLKRLLDGEEMMDI